MKKMFERNGQVVFLHSELPNGEALIADAIEEFDYEGNETLHPAELLRIVPLKTLSEKPPAKVIDQEIAKLRQQRDELQATVGAARRELDAIAKEVEKLRDERDKLLNKAGLSRLDVFINGGITHYVEVQDASYYMPRILPFDKTKDDNLSYDDEQRLPKLQKMRLLSLFGKTDGDLEWELDNYREGSFNTHKVIPCTSLEEAERVLREQIIIKMEKVTSEDLLQYALKAGVDVPLEYIEKVKAKKRKNAQDSLNNALKAAAEAQAKLDAIG